MTEQRGVRGEFILWPRGGTKDNGSECTDKDYMNISPLSSLFMPIQSSLPPIHIQYEPIFTLMLLTLGYGEKKGELESPSG